MTNIWQKLGLKYQNSVLQLIVSKSIYDPRRPYLNPSNKVATATGFIIDIANGYVLTNAHVVEDAISIKAYLLGTRKDLTLSVISIADSKDLALCQIDDNDIYLLTNKLNPSDLNMKLGDNLLLEQLDEVLVIGYPLGEPHIKFTTGIVSGFVSGDKYLPTQPLIQITAPLNPGNSGSPLLNNKGEVVGITSSGIIEMENIGYAIGIRSFISIYETMLQQRIVKMPTFSLKWQQTTPELITYKTNNPLIDGIYVQDIGPDSCLLSLCPGDIITHIGYEGKTRIMGKIDRYGDIKLNNRRFSLSEFVDMIPINASIYINIYRGTQSLHLHEKYTYIPTHRLAKIYPQLVPFDFEIIAGLCLSNLTLNLLSAFKSHPNREEGNRGGEVVSEGEKPVNEKIKCVDSRSYEEKVVITEIFPNTSVAEIKVFREGDIIKYINDHPIKRVDDIRELFRNSRDSRDSRRLQYIKIESEDKGLFIIDIEKIIDEDKLLINNLKITHPYLLDFHFI